MPVLLYNISTAYWGSPTQACLYFLSKKETVPSPSRNVLHGLPSDYQELLPSILNVSLRTQLPGRMPVFSPTLL